MGCLHALDVRMKLKQSDFRIRRCTMLEAENTTVGQAIYRTEIEQLRRGQMPALAAGVAVLAWGWLGLTLARQWDLNLNLWPTAVLLVAAYGAYRLPARRYTAACWLLIGGLASSNSLIVAGHPSTAALALGALVIITAHALLDAPQAFLVTGVAWIANSAAYLTGYGPSEDSLAVVWETGGFYTLAFAASWLATRPLRSSVEAALAGWAQAQKALRQAQEHRAEVYRVMRALEGAYHRIEHMHQEVTAKRAEAELARSQKARFAATVSHELRGPLNLILGFSRLIILSPESYGERLPPAFHADLDAIYRNSRHLAALIDDILDLAEIEAERLPLVKDRIDLEEDVVKKAVAVVAPLAERKRLDLQLQLAGDLPSILADPIRLRQALLNVLTNAVRFTEQGGITVRTSRLDDRLLVSVQDTGPGIAAEDMPKLFREFSQLGRTPTREGRGSGLGLAISKQLVELHRGEIWAESRAGAGTTFHLTLPLMDARVSSPLSSSRAVGPRPLAHGRICLVVHDDPAIIRLLARYIEGYRVIGAPGPREALLLVPELFPQALVTTPDHAQALRDELADWPYSVPVVSCGLPQGGKARGLEGILTHLVKPITPEMMEAVMRQVERKEGETTVLLVDDDPDAVRLLQAMLTALPRSYNILRAYSGFQALESLADHPADVVFMDLVMPELDGWETVARLRGDERLCQPPVVFISAQDQADAAPAVHLPLSIYQQEPLDMVRAARCLKSLLDEITPRYLPEPATPAPAAAAPPA
jgi:signal transduction histidine kinase/CheY-like chemotaxis protein